MLGCVYMHICIWTDVYALMCVHRCMHGCVHMYVCKSISFMCLHGCVFASMCCMGVCMDVYISVSACMCVYPCIFSVNIMPFAGRMSLSGDSRLSAFDYTQTSPKPLWNNPNHLGSHHTQAWGCQMWVLADVSAGIQEDRSRLSHWKMHASASQRKSTSAAIKKRVVTVNQ